VYVALDYALQIMNVMPEPGRDRVSLLRLRSSYKITDSKAIGGCPVAGGTIVPDNGDMTSDCSHKSTLS
jgi:hypothetical protein